MQTYAQLIAIGVSDALRLSPVISCPYADMVKVFLLEAIPIALEPEPKVLSYKTGKPVITTCVAGTSPVICNLIAIKTIRPILKLPLSAIVIFVFSIVGLIFIGVIKLLFYVVTNLNENQ